MQVEGLAGSAEAGIGCDDAIASAIASAGVAVMIVVASHTIDSQRSDDLTLVKT